MHDIFVSQRAQCLYLLKNSAPMARGRGRRWRTGVGARGVWYGRRREGGRGAGALGWQVPVCAALMRQRAVAGSPPPSPRAVQVPSPGPSPSPFPRQPAPPWSDPLCLLARPLARPRVVELYPGPRPALPLGLMVVRVEEKKWLLRAASFFSFLSFLDFMVVEAEPVEYIRWSRICYHGCEGLGWRGRDRLFSKEELGGIWASHGVVQRSQCCQGTTTPAARLPVCDGVWVTRLKWRGRPVSYKGAFF